MINNTDYIKTNIKELITALEKNLNKKLTKPEIINYVTYIRDLNLNNLNKNAGDLNENISKSYTMYINKFSIPFDLHDFLKKELNNSAKVSEYKFPEVQAKKEVTPIKVNTPQQVPIQQLQQLQVASQIPMIPQLPVATVPAQQSAAPAQQSTVTQTINNFPNLKTRKEQIDFTKIINYRSLWRDSNVLIDSRYQNIANSDRSRIVFNIVSNTKNKIPGSGVITSISNMRDIVELEIFPFSIPYLPAAENYYNKITLSILELSANSIDSYEDSQFHFMFDAKVNGNLINLEPINKIFSFNKPITRINDFTLRFGSPLNPIVFDKDRLTTTNIDYTSNPGIITFTEAHNLTTGDLIYINDFNTLTPAADLNIINEINNTQGHLCTRLDNFAISINVDFSLIAPSSQIPGLIINVYFGSKRIFLPFRFRYLIGTDE
jgi:hypothetical protein